MWFRPKPSEPVLTSEQQLAALPLRNAKAEIVADTPQRLTLRVALVHRGTARLLQRFLRLKDHRLIELTDLDLHLHRWCDGQTSVGAMIERLAREEHLGWNEARAIVLSYLPRLTQRGLLVVAREG